MNKISIPIHTPAELRNMHPLNQDAEGLINKTRKSIADILSGKSKRILVIVGPCSLDDKVMDDGTPAVIRFAETIKELRSDKTINSHLEIIMRCPPAKPRTSTGWAGLEQTNLEQTHYLLSAIANLQVPIAIEVMHERHFARFGNLLSVAWVGARNVYDTMLRHAVSAYPELPVLFKNDSNGNIHTAVDALITAAESHTVDLIDQHNKLNRLISIGNQSAGIILRGGSSVRSPDDFDNHISEGINTGRPLVIDCAHGNAAAHDSDNKKSIAGQLSCSEHVLALIRQGTPINGLMLEAHLLEGNSDTVPGMSVTDPCIDIETASAIIQKLSAIRSNIDNS